tara:strand:- start:110 stop:379 length:270 start_codon:yes stop_codon:yes gene_type:complete
METTKNIFMHLVIAGSVIDEIHRATLVSELCRDILDDNDFMDAPECLAYYIAEELNEYLKAGFYEEFIEKVKLELVIRENYELLKELNL